jgi:hypothetical protein
MQSAMQKARKLICDSGTVLPLIKLVESVAVLIEEQARLRATLASAQEQINELPSKGSSTGFMRPAHLARLSDFTYEQAGQNRTEAARMVLRHMSPQLANRDLPDDLEALAKQAAKAYGDTAKAYAQPLGANHDWSDSLDDLDL